MGNSIDYNADRNNKYSGNMDPNREQFSYRSGDVGETWIFLLSKNLLLNSRNILECCKDNMRSNM